MDINHWKQRGKISIWHYKGMPRNYPGYHLTCNKDGASSFIELINLFIQTDTVSKRTILLTTPSQGDLMVPNCKIKNIVMDKLAISRSISDTKEWSLKKEEKKLTLTIGTSMLIKLRSGILDISQGKGDYCIGSSEEELWFWW